MNSIFKPRTSKLGALLALLPLLLTVVPTARATHKSPGVQVMAEASGVRLRWSLGPAAAGAARSVPPAMQLVALEVRGDAALAPRLEHLAARDWTGLLPADDQAAATVVPDMPTAPLMVLRSSRVRRRRIDVLRVSPVFGAAASPRLATALEAFVPGASPLDPNAAAFWSSTEPFGDAHGPGTPASPALPIVVSTAGMQLLTGHALAAAGFTLAGVDPRRLHLRSAGHAVALELRGTADSRFNAGDELRFWAPAPGNRWNRTTTYWLSADPTDGLRIASRNVASGGAALRRPRSTPTLATAASRTAAREGRAVITGSRPCYVPAMTRPRAPSTSPWRLPPLPAAQRP